MAGRWVDLQTAAEILGTSTEAMRKRATRGTLESEKREDGRVYVRVDDDRTEGGREAQGEPSVVDELRDRLRFVERQLEIEQEARRRADTIIAQLSQANATLASRVPQLEAPEAPREPQKGDQEATEGAAEGSTPTGTPSGPESGGERPWWRRWFGE